ncbi:MarR family transcriptional regulator [Pseudacidovorax intermedius]|uniref:MarR family transcriptional regulator n=1 Tax=Pseudacidovorax intermedius TaxID=433924 RepID=UPI0009E77C04|nr:MarR family transcriptional regulator [Pseudacidovorax intermedius]
MTNKPAARSSQRRPSPAPSAPAQPRRNLPLLLLQVRAAIVGRFRHVLKKTGLTEQQFRILRALHVRGTLEPRELCAICHISSPSLSGVLARMEGMGLVQRERHPDDQRRQHVSLSPQARQMFADVSEDMEAVYQELEAALGPAFVDQMYAMCDTVLAVLDTSGEQLPAEDDA